MRTGPRGRRREIVGEELVRATPGGTAVLYEVLECGHRQPGVYDEDGTSCSVNGLPVKTRVCKGCRDGKPTGPPGEVVLPKSDGPGTKR